MFRKGLKNNIKNELLRYKGIINNIKSLIRVFIEINNKLYKQAIKKKFNDLRKKAGTYTRYLVYKRKTLRKGVQNNRFKNLNYIGLILIELDFI